MYHLLDAIPSKLSISPSLACVSSQTQWNLRRQSPYVPGCSPSALHLRRALRLCLASAWDDCPYVSWARHSASPPQRPMCSTRRRAPVAPHCTARPPPYDSVVCETSKKDPPACRYVPSAFLYDLRVKATPQLHHPYARWLQRRASENLLARMKVVSLWTGRRVLGANAPGQLFEPLAVRLVQIPHACSYSQQSQVARDGRQGVRYDPAGRRDVRHCSNHRAASREPQPPRCHTQSIPPE